MDLRTVECPEVPENLSSLDDLALCNLTDALTIVCISIETELQAEGVQTSVRGTRTFGDYRAWRRATIIRLNNVQAEKTRVKNEQKRRHLAQQGKRASGKVDWSSSMVSLSKAIASWSDAPEKVRDAAAELARTLSGQHRP